MGELVRATGGELVTDGDPLIFLLFQCFSSCDANDSEKRLHRSRARRSEWLGFTWKRIEILEDGKDGSRSINGNF